MIDTRLKKLALKRDPSYPIGQSAPLHVDCQCGRQVPIAGKVQSCDDCGQAYDADGWLIDSSTEAERRGFDDARSGHDPDPPHGRQADRTAYRKGYARGRAPIDP